MVWSYVVTSQSGAYHLTDEQIEKIERGGTQSYFLFTSFIDGNPNATIDPRIPLDDWILPVGTRSIPSPIDGPPAPTGPGTVDSHISFPVLLSNAKINPVLIWWVDRVCPFPCPCSLEVVGFSTNGIYPENTNPCETIDDTNGGKFTL